MVKGRLCKSRSIGSIPIVLSTIFIIFAYKYNKMKENSSHFKRQITDDQIQEIIDYRLKGLSLRKIGVKIGFSYETVRYYVDKQFPKDKKNIYIQTKTRHKKPKPRHRSTRDYDFLQYVRPVFKWATENSELTRPQVELMLYLYPKGVFTKKDFYDFHKILGMYQIKTFQLFVKKGFMTTWRPKKKGQKALYTLTNKAKQICDKMHKFLTGEKEIPVNSRNNVLAREEGVRINGYYMDVIKKMNKNRKDI